MSDFNPMDRVKKMVAAIRSEAKEKADQILDHGMQQFKLEKNKIINQQKDKVIQEYKVKIDQYSVQKRIQRSAKINESRIKKMNNRQDLMNNLKEDLKQRLLNTIKDEKTHKILLTKLLIQGLIKLMEPQVQIRCMKKDVPLIESIMEQCSKEFQAMVKKECNKDLKVQLMVDTNNYLDEKNTNSIGGVVLTCLQGKIVCSNTLENRLNLAFQESLPDVRNGLFPEYKQAQIKKEPVKAQQQHH